MLQSPNSLQVLILWKSGTCPWYLLLESSAFFKNKSGFKKSTFSTCWISSQIFNTRVTKHMNHKGWSVPQQIGSKGFSVTLDLTTNKTKYVISWAEVSWKSHYQKPFEFSFLHQKWQYKSCQPAYGVECKLWKNTDAKKIKQSKIFP